MFYDTMTHDLIWAMIHPDPLPMTYHDSSTNLTLLYLVPMIHPTNNQPWPWPTINHDPLWIMNLHYTLPNMTNELPWPIMIYHDPLWAMTHIVLWTTITNYRWPITYHGPLFTMTHDPTIDISNKPPWPQTYTEPWPSLTNESNDPLQKPRLTCL